MAHPDIKYMQLTSGKLIAEGYESIGFGTDGSPATLKEHSIFSEASYILQDLLYVQGQYDYTNELTIVNDHDGTVYPEVYEAWVASGGDPGGLCNVAMVPSLAKWAVGMGGKKNGERAAKLVLACAIAKDDPPALQTTIRNYPSFGRLLGALGLAPGTVPPQPDYGAMAAMGGIPMMGGKMGGKGMRFSPY